MLNYETLMPSIQVCVVSLSIRVMSVGAHLHVIISLCLLSLSNAILVSETAPAAFCTARLFFSFFSVFPFSVSPPPPPPPAPHLSALPPSPFLSFCLLCLAHFKTTHTSLVWFSALVSISVCAARTVAFSLGRLNTHAYMHAPDHLLAGNLLLITGNDLTAEPTNHHERNFLLRKFHKLTTILQQAGAAALRFPYF